MELFIPNSIPIGVERRRGGVGSSEGGRMYWGIGGSIVGSRREGEEKECREPGVRFGMLGGRVHESGRAGVTDTVGMGMGWLISALPMIRRGGAW
jgi:hypothetical protein